MNVTDRRQFLKHTGTLAAGALAAPLIIPASARGADGTTAPSERITIGMIGMGKMCWGHLGDMLNRQTIHIAALCDVETERLEKCRRRVEDMYGERYGKENYKGCDAVGDFRQILARPDIDAVLIATPTNWHAVMSVAACRAGKDVYCEKPLSLTIREARAVADAATRYGVVFQTGSQQRSDYKFRFACELVRNGCIGRVKEIYVNVGGPPEPCYLPAEPTPETLDWDMWLGPAPYRPFNAAICPLDDYKSWPRWRYYRDFGGGGMTDWGAHHFDIAQWALGMDESGPVEIIPPDGRDVKRLTYRYANGTVMYHGGAQGGAGVDFIGTEGRIGVNRGYLKVEPESLMREKWGPNDIRLYQSKSHKDNWLECIRTRRECICTADIGCRSVSVCHLGNIAYRLKRPLRWDPAGEQFVDDEPANRLVGRPMRSPWRV
jgi:predicted dehydrogenase